MSEAGRSKLDRCHRDAGQTPNRGCDGRREGPGDVYGPIPRLGESLHSQTSAAATSADTPVFSVGSMTGADSGEWFDGSSTIRAAMCSALLAPAN